MIKSYNPLSSINPTPTYKNNVLMHDFIKRSNASSSTATSLKISTSSAILVDVLNKSYPSSFSNEISCIIYPLYLSTHLSPLSLNVPWSKQICSITLS